MRTYTPEQLLQKKATSLAWYAANKERTRANARAWYRANKKKAADYTRKWRATNPELKRAQERKQYWKNPAKARAGANAWRIANRERILEKRRSLMKETVVETRLRDAVIARGGMCPKFVDPGRKGAPDRLVLLPGRPTYYVELKRPKRGKVEDHQTRYHNSIRAAGQQVFVLSTIAAVDEWLRIYAA